MRQQLGFIFQDLGCFCASRDLVCLADFFAKCEAIINPDNVEE